MLNLFSWKVSLHQEEMAINNTDDDFWARLFIELPDGIHRVSIVGHRDDNTNYTGGVLIDDISIQPCGNYCKQVS